MQLFKKIVLAAVLVTAPLSVFAEAAGAAKVREAAVKTIEKINEAIELADKKGDKTQIHDLIGEARQSQKEFRFEGTERQRQLANNKLSAAREAIKEGKVDVADKALKEALQDFSEMLKVYDEKHK